MTKLELIEALNLYFDDDDVIVISCEKDGGWSNIQRVGTCNGIPAIFWGDDSIWSEDK